jgi:hypothetical protein
MLDYFNLWTPNELAEFGIASKDGLAQALGASLDDHITKLDSITELLLGKLEPSASSLESVVYELEALAARADTLRDTLANIEDAIRDIKGKF